MLKDNKYIWVIGKDQSDSLVCRSIPELKALRPESQAAAVRYERSPEPSTIGPSDKERIVAMIEDRIATLDALILANVRDHQELSQKLNRGVRNELLVVREIIRVMEPVG